MTCELGLSNSVDKCSIESEVDLKISVFRLAFFNNFNAQVLE